MSLPVPSFAALAAGNQNLSLFDQQFGALAAQGVIACTASGANAVVLTPMTNYFVPSGYTDAAPVFTWKQAQGSTAAVTINVANLGAVNAYKNNGQTAVGNGDLVSGAVYTAAYLGALNGGAGGFVVDVVPTALSAAGPVQGAFKNLVVTNQGVATPNNQANISADAITLFDGTNYSTATSVNVTADLTVAGVNGLDTGAVQASTWYSEWVIQNTASGALAAIFSASFTAPTMPAGYAKKSRCGAAQTDASKHIIPFIQRGRRQQYVIGTLLQLANSSGGGIGTINTTTFTGVATPWAGFAPPTASSLHLLITSQGQAEAVAVAPNNNYSGYNSVNPIPLVNGAQNAGVWTNNIVIETANVYVACASTHGIVFVLGYEDNL